jgi:predicted nucleotide-binding protein
MEGKPFKIFVSFHDRDDGLYNAIKAAFAKDGKVQVYRRSLDVGDRRWIYDPEKLYDSLDCPNLALAIISPSQRADPWFEHELPALFALERYLKSDFIIPVLAGDMTDTQLPIYLRGRDYVDCRSTEAEGVARLTDFVTRARARRASEVFLVHGHDSGAKDSVARFIEGLGLEPVILHEQATRGMTIIEKLEQHADACFAVVILTADDVGALRKEPKKRLPRARQNVIFELGLFIGRLGRSQIFALKKDDIELPSDYVGVGFIPMDEAGMWKEELEKEMKRAGCPIDTDRRSR